MSVTRKDATLNDAIDHLDGIYSRCQADVQKALSMLSHDEHEFIDDEIEKCLDLRYYLENYHCIRDESGNWKSFYPWFEYQEILYQAIQEEWESNEYCKIIVLKPRQSGISTWTAASMFHRTIFTPRMYTMIVGQDADTTSHIYNMSMNAYSALPWWLKPEYMYKTKGDEIVFQRVDEAVRSFNDGLGSTLKCSNAKKMSGVAIGRSLQSFHGSEASRWADDGMFEADIKPSMNARDIYAIIESTGYGRQGFFYDHWRGALEEENGYRAVFIPVYRSRKYYLPFSRKDPNKNVVLREAFTLKEEEVKFNDRVKREESFDIPKEFWNFRRKGLLGAKRGNAKAGFMESYPLTPTEAFQASGICAFDRDKLEEQQMSNVCIPLYSGHITLGADDATPNPIIREVSPGEILPKRKGVNASEPLRVWVRPEQGATYELGCLPDGELVRTDKGPMSIESVGSTEKLLDGDGNYVPITAFMRKKYDGELVKIRTYGASRFTKFTPNHPILVFDKSGKSKWKEAGDVVHGDVVRIPIPKSPIIRGRELLSKWPSDEIRIDFRVDEACLWNTEFWWFVGLWLADGWAADKHNTGVISVALNAKTEVHVRERFERFVAEISGRPCFSRVRDGCIHVQFNSIQICRFLHRNFGNRAHNKQIPEWVKTLPTEHLLAMVHGYYLGDGCIEKANKKRTVRSMSFVSVSEKLLNDFQDILLRIGVFGGVSVLREAGKKRFKPNGKEFETVKTFQMRVSGVYASRLGEKWRDQTIPRYTKGNPNKTFTWIDDGFLYSKVYKAEREDFSGFVNNFETETHTFCAALITTHNCDSALGVKDGDYSACAVWRVGSGMQPDELVATWLGHAPPGFYARAVAALGYWYNGAEIACEYQGPGISVGDKLKDLDYPALYRPQHHDRVGNTMGVHLHWLTTIKTRDQIIGALNEALLEESVKIYDEDLIEECTDFGSLNGGSRFEGIDNKDDLCMGSMIGLFCARETNKHIKSSPATENVRTTGNINSYGVYDNLMRQRGQYALKADAEKQIEGMKGWMVRPILVCKANTLFSPIFDGMGSVLDGGSFQSELHYKHGMNSMSILPDVVNSYKEAMQGVGAGGTGRNSDEW